MANPPFNLSNWGQDKLKDDVRWKYGTPPAGNAYNGDEKIASDNVFITHNAGKGIYYNVELTSVNDYTWTL